MTKSEREVVYRQRVGENLRILLNGSTSPLGELEESGQTDRYVAAIKARLALAAVFLTQLSLFPRVDMAVKTNGSFMITKDGLLYAASEGTEKIFLDQRGRLYVSMQAISEGGSEIPLFGENQPDASDDEYTRFFSAALTAVDGCFRRRRAKANILHSNS